MNLNANFPYNGVMHLLHKNLSSCLEVCMCKVMSIKLLEMRKAPAESEAFNLDNPKLQIFLICNVYDNNKLHPRVLLDMNNTISLWSVLTKQFHDVRHSATALHTSFNVLGST